MPSAHPQTSLDADIPARSEPLLGFHLRPAIVLAKTSLRLDPKVLQIG